MSGNEQAIIGWKAIARMFNISLRSMIKRRDEMLNSGAIFYMNLGKPPHKRVSAFPSVLKAWQIRKSAKGEMI